MPHRATMKSDRRDLTEVFRFEVKNQRSVLRKSPSEPITPSYEPSRFLREANKLLNNFRQVDEDIKNKRDEYLDLHQFFTYRSNAMTDEERMSWEKLLEKLQKQFGHYLSSLEDEANIEEKPDNQKHKLAIVKYLKLKEARQALKIRNLKERRKKKNTTEIFSRKKRQKGFRDLRSASCSMVYFPDEEKKILELSKNEANELEQENMQFFAKMEDHAEEQLKKTQAQMKEISELAAKQSELLLEQETQLTTIDELVDTSIKDVKGGNEHLKQAAATQVSNRFAVLMALSIMTFSLLFLDWFNP